MCYVLQIVLCAYVASAEYYKCKGMYNITSLETDKILYRKYVHVRHEEVFKDVL